MSAPLLSVRDLRKNYGATEALRGVSFEIQPGELFGLVGPNGAGKTTLLSILACLAAPTSGQVQFAGKALRLNDLPLRTDIGIGTQDLAIYFELSARENLEFFGRLYGLRGGDLKQRVDEVLDFVALRERADQRVATFSGGMRRRLNLGAAIVHRPRLLLLDEPTTGVDPQSRMHIFDGVRRLNAAGTTIIYTSHYMEEVQTLCPRVGILDNGRLIACDQLSNLLQMLEGTIIVKVGHSVAEAAERLRHLPTVRLVGVADEAITLACWSLTMSAARVVNALRGLSIQVTEFETREPKLEDVFLHLTQKTLRD